MSWSYGLRGISAPGGDAHAHILRRIWELGGPAGGEPLRDRQVIAGIEELFEIDDRGVFRKLAPRERDEIVMEIRSLPGGDHMSWSNELAADFHVDVPAIGVPWFVLDSDGRDFCEARAVSLPGSTLDGARAQFVRTQASALSIDEASEVLAEHGLTGSEAFRLNERTRFLSDLAVVHRLVMTYG